MPDEELLDKLVSIIVGDPALLSFFATRDKDLAEALQERQHQMLTVDLLSIQIERPTVSV